MINFKNKKSLLQLLLAFVMAFTLTACGKGDSSSQPKKDDSRLLVNFEGMTKLEVEEWINQNSIDREKVFYSYEYSDTVQEGKIIRQSIAAGLPMGDESLTITISNGTNPDDMIELPDFTKMTNEEIQQWFINEGFTNVSVEYVTGTNVEPGKFVGLNVTDSKVRRNQQIIVKLAAEKAAPTDTGAKMENMAGWTKQQVDYWANTNQVSVDYSYARSASVAAGNVISFAPAAGQSVAKGGRISVVLSQGSEVSAIDMTRMSRADIEKWGTDNGIQISWIQCWHQSPSGTIYSNSPNKGTMRQGDIMRVYISVGPIPVKDYTGLSYQYNFMGWLNSINSQYNASANLKVMVTEQQVTDKDSGTILSQSPNSGYANPGSTITMVIAKKVDPTPAPTAKPTPTPTPDQYVTIPNLSGMSEYDFKRSLHAYGVWEGQRSVSYSDNYPEGYVIYNDTGVFMVESSIDYCVSLGSFYLDADSWYGRPYSALEGYIYNANRNGAGVTLHTSRIDTGDPNMDGCIMQIMGPESNGDILVRVGLYSPEPEEHATGFDPDAGGYDGGGDYYTGFGWDDDSNG
jgi:serine/threonine-protein kinase